MVNIHEAKTNLSRLLQRVQAGEEVIIAKSGKPIARLVRIEEPLQTRHPGNAAGVIHISDDFDSPLPDDLLDQFER
jgi:prevent-host-death family protein